MAKTGKIWKLMLWTLIAAIIINALYFYLSTEAVSNANVAKVATVVTPVVSAINYIIMGLAAGMGFYLAKEMTAN